MGVLTIREFDAALEKRLRLRAAASGRSVEEEARRILADGLGPIEGGGLASDIAAHFEPLGGVEIDDFPHTGLREPPDFSAWDEEPDDPPGYERRVGGDEAA